MNYYERHVGDYAKDTKELSMLEHGAYNLLLDYYYAKEEGIPNRKIYKVTQAKTKAEKAAVDEVLQEFFTLVDEVWIKNRVEEEIEKYQASIPEAERKKQNDKERQQRARERRKALFSQLESLGSTMPWNAPVTALQEELSRLQSRSSHANVTPPVTRDNTATRPQAPDTIPQTPPESAVVNSETEPPRKAEVRSLGKFPMRTDWKPDPEALAFCCAASGFNGASIAPAVLAEFVIHWSEESAANTERQWCQKLIQSAQRTALRTPAAANTDTRSALEILRAGLPDSEQQA